MVDERILQQSELFEDLMELKGQGGIKPEELEEKLKTITTDAMVWTMQFGHVWEKGVEGFATELLLDRLEEWSLASLVDLMQRMHKDGYEHIRYLARNAILRKLAKLPKDELAAKKFSHLEELVEIVARRKPDINYIRKKHKLPVL